ncbi:MAG: hypothetical protein RLZZ609_2955 [Cyanobacteriota bacterium]|jgi:hypothetical protein
MPTSLVKPWLACLSALAATSLSSAPAHASLENFLINFATPATGSSLPTAPLVMNFPSGFAGTASNASAGGAVMSIQVRGGQKVGYCDDNSIGIGTGYCQLNFNFDVEKIVFNLVDDPGGSISAFALDSLGNVLSSNNIGSVSFPGQVVTFTAGATPYRSLRWRDDFAELSYIYNLNVYRTPGPLPALGAFAAFGYSRKLRKRLRDGKMSTAA